MPITIGSNIASLGAQRQLSRASDTIGTIYERLASGQRIVHASDDAAGLSIADSLNAQKRTSLVAQRNISDGLSMLQIASAAIQSQSDLITRMRELAEQSANGVYTDIQRTGMDKEYQSLLKEFNRIAATAKFNNINLLSSMRNGNPDSFNLQVGITGSTTSQITISGNDTGTMSGFLNINCLHDNGADDGSLDLSDYFVFSDNGGSLHGYKFVNISDVVDSAGNKRQVALLAIDYEDIDETTRVLGFGVVSRREGQNDWDFVTTDNSVSGTAMPGFLGLGVNFDIATGRAQSAISTVQVNFGGGASSALKYDFSALQLVSGEEQSSAIDFTTVSNQSSARYGMSVLQQRSDELASIQGSMGAQMSRLGTAFNNNSNFGINVLAAESRIRDVDVANEAANLVRSTILQQVASSVLSQANQLPNLVLALLR